MRNKLGQLGQRGAITVYLPLQFLTYSPHTCSLPHAGQEKTGHYKCTLLQPV